jgi:succinate-acetate transporter protein
LQSTKISKAHKWKLFSIFVLARAFKMAHPVDKERKVMRHIGCVTSLLLLAIFTPLVWATTLSSSNKDLLLLEHVRLAYL